MVYREPIRAFRFPSLFDVRFSVFIIIILVVDIRKLSSSTRIVDLPISPRVNPIPLIQPSVLPRHIPTRTISIVHLQIPLQIPAKLLPLLPLRSHLRAQRLQLSDPPRALLARARGRVDEVAAAREDGELAGTGVEEVDRVAFAGVEVEFPARGAGGWRRRGGEDGAMVVMMGVGDRGWGGEDGRGCGGGGIGAIEEGGEGEEGWRRGGRGVARGARVGAIDRSGLVAGR